MLSNGNAENYELETDSDDDFNAQEKAENKDQSRNGSVTRDTQNPALLHYIEGPGILPEEAVSIAPGEGDISFYHSNEENWEALAFPRLYSHGENHFNSYRDVRLTPKYAHARLKCADDGSASDTKYIYSTV